MWAFIKRLFHRHWYDRPSVLEPLTCIHCGTVWTRDDWPFADAHGQILRRNDGVGTNIPAEGARSPSGPLSQFIPPP